MGVVAVIIESRQAVGKQEHLSVEYDIPLDGIDPQRTKFMEHRPQAFNGEFRVATETDIQVALEGVSLEGAVSQEAGGPAVIGAEDFQRRIGGEYLHDGAGAHHRVGVDVLLDTRAIHWNGSDAQAVEVLQGFLREAAYLTAPDTLVHSLGEGCRCHACQQAGRNNACSQRAGQDAQSGCGQCSKKHGRNIHRGGG